MIIMSNQIYSFHHLSLELSFCRLTCIDDSFSSAWIIKCHLCFVRTHVHMLCISWIVTEFCAVGAGVVEFESSKKYRRTGYIRRCLRTLKSVKGIKRNMWFLISRFICFQWTSCVICSTEFFYKLKIAKNISQKHTRTALICWHHIRFKIVKTLGHLISMHLISETFIIFKVSV